MDLNEDETMNVAEDYEDTLQDAYDDDSEIDGDCNESQPCRGDEPWLQSDLDTPIFERWQDRICSAEHTSAERTVLTVVDMTGLF